MPGLSGGMAMDPTSNVAYVSGTPATTHSDGAVPDERSRASRGTSIHVLSYDKAPARRSASG